MIILANFLNAIANVLGIILTFFTWMIVVQALISWVNPDPYNPIVRFLHASTEPVYRILRRVLPRGHLGPVDFAPLVALFVLIFLNYFLVQTIKDYALWLRAGQLPPVF